MTRKKERPCSNSDTSLKTGVGQLSKCELVKVCPGLTGADGAGFLSGGAFICRVFFTCALYPCFLCVYRVRQNKPGPFIFRSKYLSLHRAFFCSAVWRGVALALRRCARVGATPADRPFSCYFFFSTTTHNTQHTTTHNTQRTSHNGPPFVVSSP